MTNKITGRMLFYFFVLSHAFLQGMESSLICNQGIKKSGKKVKPLFHYCLYSTLRNKFFAQTPEEIEKDLTLLNNEVKESLTDLVNKPLHKRYGHTRLHKAPTPLRIRQLLTLGANADTLTHLQETPLVSLLKENKIAEALALLEQVETLDVNQADADGMNALTLAFNLKSVHVAEALFRRGATSSLFGDMRHGLSQCRQKIINSRGYQKLVSLWSNNEENKQIEENMHSCLKQPTAQACKDYFLHLPLKMQQAVVDLLNTPVTPYGHTYFHLAQTACDVQKLLCLKARKMFTKMGEDPLSYMIKCGNRDAAFELLLYLPPDDCNTTDLYGLTPLCNATRAGDTDLVLALLQNGADATYVYASKNYCISCFHMVAPHTTKYKMMRVLFNKGSKVISHAMRLDLMCLAVEHDNAYMLTRLLPKGSTLDMFFGNWNLILYAVHERRMHCVQKFLAGEVKMCEKTLDGATIPKKTKPVSVQLSIANAHGITPLMMAVENDDYDTVGRLIKLGVALDASDYKGRTALIYAIKFENFALAKLLLDSGANKDQADILGATPLHYAVNQENFSFTKLLLDAGADPAKADRFGKTPLHIATVNKWNPYLVKLLRSGGKKIKETETVTDKFL